MKKALLVVDVQNDFLPGGTLAVNDGDQVIPVINQLLELPFDIIVASQDWHPKNHCSFENLWPVHCVEGTPGAAFSSKLHTSKFHHVIHKGTDVNIDSYSAFFDNDKITATELDKLLKDNNISEIYVAGLATDYCVKFTVLDALSLGYVTHVVTDACRGVEVNPGDVDRAKDEMRTSGAHLIHSSAVLQH